MTLQNYFTKILEDNIKAIIKPQYVDAIPKMGKIGEATVNDTHNRKDERKTQDTVTAMLDLTRLRDRKIEDLSGGELQRFAIAMTCIQAANVYMFDEPSSYLDVKQRLNAARAIRNLRDSETFVIVVEHDLSVLDYMSDFICCLYGVQGAYGVVTMPFSVREGINVFLDGFVPTENLRFRETALTFKVSEKADEVVQKKLAHYVYPKMSKKLGTLRTV